jgi:hypothetical protein
VDENVGVVRVDLRRAIVIRIGLFKLLLIAQNLKKLLSLIFHLGCLISIDYTSNSFPRILALHFRF